MTPFGSPVIGGQKSSPEENSCIPITHFQCKTHFEHLLSHIRSVFKSAAKVGNPIEMTNTPPRVASHDGTITSHDGTFLRAHMDFSQLGFHTFTLHIAEYEVGKAESSEYSRAQVRVLPRKYCSTLGAVLEYSRGSTRVLP